MTEPFETEITEEELNDVEGEAIDNKFKFPGMTYADGVAATIAWIRGDRDEHPMAD